jgi:molybdenum cofactor cytidylyltransferase
VSPKPQSLDIDCNDVVAIILAAGSARRFGSIKQLQEFRGDVLVRRAVRTAEQVCGNRTLLVTGNEGQLVADACRPLSGYFVHNEQYKEGMGRSIACAVGAVQTTAAAILLLLADQPLVTAAHLQALLNLWKASPQSIVASSYAGTVGPPIVFPRRCFAELTDLQGDTGARNILQRHAASVIAVDFADGRVDIDRPEDLDPS